jgi:hypothetical protein
LIFIRKMQLAEQVLLVVLVGCMLVPTGWLFPSVH